MIIKLLYNSWEVIAIASTIIGIFSAFSFFKSPKNSPSKSFTKAISIFLFCMAILTFISGIINRTLYTKVPDVTELSIDNATQTLNACELKIEYSLHQNEVVDLNWTVTQQSYAEGDIVRKGTIITIAYETPFPDNTKDDESNIEQNSLDTHYNVSDTEFTDYDSQYNNVSTEDIDPNSQYDNINTGSTGVDEENINLNDSIEYVLVPNVIGMEQSSGTNLIYLNCLQFQVWWHSSDISDDSDKYYIIDQEPKAGEYVEKGTLIQLQLSSTYPYKISDDTYLIDDESVKSYNELGYYIIKNPSSSCASVFNINTNESYYPEYITEKLCYIEILAENVNISEAVLSISNIGNNNGFVIDNNNGMSQFYISKGEYIISADINGTYLNATLNVTKSGTYFLTFE